MTIRRRNPETILTGWFRGLIEKRGAFCYRVSDAYTRGIPDLTVTTDRVIVIEMKIRPGGPTRSFQAMVWKALGVRGAQDHFIRQICRRSEFSACVVSGTEDEDPSSLALWVPVHPEIESNDSGDYLAIAVGVEEVMGWLSLNASRT